jgi:shikimate dehydrogenase
MRNYGLIGKSLIHSFSPRYFRDKFNELCINDCSYQAFELPSLGQIKALIYENDLSGFNVTIPYKQLIIPYLDEISLIASEINSVNTVTVKNDLLCGENTDYLGFENTLLKYLQSFHKRALIFGTGGSSKTITYVLKSLGIECTHVSQSNHDLMNYTQIDNYMIKSHQILINTTPLGTFPKVDTCVDIPYSAITKNHLCYDLVYNPKESLFLAKSKLNGAMIVNGLDMLKIQADKSWKLWNG